MLAKLKVPEAQNGIITSGLLQRPTKPSCYLTCLTLCCSVHEYPCERCKNIQRKTVRFIENFKAVDGVTEHMETLNLAPLQDLIREPEWNYMYYILYTYHSLTEYSTQY